MTASVPSRPVRRHWGGPNALPEKIARALGWRRHRAEAAIWGPFNYGELCARIIEVLRQAGASDTLQKFAAPILSALNGTAPPSLTPALELAAQEADAAEDVADKRFDLHRCRETMEAELRAVEKELIAKHQYRDALAAKLGRP